MSSQNAWKWTFTMEPSFTNSDETIESALRSSPKREIFLTESQCSQPSVSPRVHCEARIFWVFWKLSERLPEPEGHLFQNNLILRNMTGEKFRSLMISLILDAQKIVLNAYKWNQRTHWKQLLIELVDKILQQYKLQEEDCGGQQTRGRSFLCRHLAHHKEFYQ